MQLAKTDPVTARAVAMARVNDGGKVHALLGKLNHQEHPSDGEGDGHNQQFNSTTSNGIMKAYRAQHQQDSVPAYGLGSGQPFGAGLY